SRLGRYDTIAFDCVAMNVNDLLCIGARPIAMVDYLGVHTLDGARVEQILEGLGAAAKEAGIAVPGGEIAQLPEVIGSDGTGPGDPSAFDLVGTAIGIVHPERLILGRDVSAGDAIIGIASAGIHSNGLSLARRVLLAPGAYRLDDHVEELGRIVGEELLEPTVIYVRAVVDLWDAGIRTKGLVHVTGDGLANLSRLEADAGYLIERIPEPPAIFSLIQRTGELDDAEMFRVFNMGIGFVVVVAPEQQDAAIERLGARGHRAALLGRVTGETGLVRIEPAGLVGGLRGSDAYFEPR
ncbi:MAG: phosphoribosylformylglycinamidine cyclo-ligase, partial [Actinomycetota bacterium]